MSKQIKPTLCCDYDESKLKFPLILMPKIDGCRGINIDGKFTGRSLKPFKNKYITEKMSKEEYIGFDGEVAADIWTSASLCRDTTSALNSIKGEPQVTWWVFDCIHPKVIDMPYKERLAAATTLIVALRVNTPTEQIQVVPWEMVYSVEEVEAADAKFLAQGFEGTILRDPNGMHKSGRATAKEGSYMRIKRFTDAEAVVLSIDEAMKNNNEAKVNELGRTERSSHQENLEAKGMVGSLICKCLETGETITVGAGAMDHAERTYYFENQSEIIGKTIKYKSFRKGVKNLPRFPTFLSIRAVEDM